MKLTEHEIIVLRETFLFHHMTADEYLDFSQREHPAYLHVSMEAGEKLQFPELSGNCIAIVISGTLRLIRNDKLPARILREGFIIGAVDLFSVTAYNVPEIYAAEDAGILFLTAGQVRQLFEWYPSIMLRYIKFLTGQLQTLRWENSLVTTASVEARLLQFLAQNAHRERNTAVVCLDYSFSALADRLHFSRATLYRVFEHMEKENFLRREGRTLIILKPELLPAAEFI